MKKKAASFSPKELEQHLTEFVMESKVKGRGPLSVVLVLTRKAKGYTPPFSHDSFLSPQGGQVAGLGGTAVQAILGDYGITRILAEEGGRTKMAFSRQREAPGTMLAGAVMQHLVGAKLEVALPDVKFEHHGYTVADEPSGRKGDFVINDTAIHVTTAPTESLIRKCCDNLAVGLRPLVITTQSGVGGAAALARNADVFDRIDILEIEQFVTTNVYEWCSFQQTKRPQSIRRLIEIYNRIIDECETDPSMKITIGQ